MQGDASVVVAEDITVVFALLEERRANLAAQRVRSVNQLHALLRDLIPGGAPKALKANTAAMLLRRVRPKTPPEATRKALAWDLVREIRSIDTRLEAITAQMTEALHNYSSWSCPGFVDGFRLGGQGSGWGVGGAPFVVGG